MSASFPQSKQASSTAEDECMGLLPPDFVPGKWEVICQRGKECFDHVGNRQFRMCIESHLDNYVKVKSRQQKSKIVRAIVLNLRNEAAQSGGGLVRKDLLTRRWFKVGDKLAREKVGQALRNAIKTRRLSGKKQAANGVKKASSDPGLKNLKEQPTIHLPTTNRMVSLQNKKEGVHLQECNRMLSFNSPALPSLSALDSYRQPPQNFGQNASSLYFGNQLSADLEPTPIQIQSTMRLPDIFDRDNMSNIRNEASTSSRLRFYDIDSSRASLPNVVNISKNIDGIIGLNTETAKLPTPFDSLVPIDPITPRSQSCYPSYEQQMPPSVVERRRHSLVRSGIDGDISFHPIGT